MKDIAIYCAGGFGREVYTMIKRINNPEWNFIGFFDDTIEKGSQLQYGICLGGINELNQWNTPINIVIANGSPSGLKSIHSKIVNPLVEFPTIIDPSCEFLDFDTVKLGKGVILSRGTRLSVNVELGDFTICNTEVRIGHDAKVGKYNAFMPGVRVSGCVCIGDENLFGSMSFVLQCLKMGSNIRLSPCSVLLTKPKDGCLYMGNPAKKVII